MFCPGLFYHPSCAEADTKRKEKQAADREQIDLYKKAIREVQAEDNNKLFEPPSA